MSEESSQGQEDRPQRSGEDRRSGEAQRSGKVRRKFVRQRVPVVQRVTFKYTYDTPVTAPVADLGEGGAFILTANPVPAGTELKYKLSLPDDPPPIQGQVRVVREEEGLGMAVEFQNLNQEDQDRIKFFVASVLFKVPPGS